MATANLIDGLNNFSTNLTSGITSSDTTITLDDVTGLPTAQGVLVIDRVDSSGTATPTKREYIRYSAVVGSTVTLDSAAVGRGFGGSTAQAHTAGAVVEMVMTAEHHNYLIDSYATQHNDNGTHGAVTATSVKASNMVGVHAWLSAAQLNLANGVWTDLVFDSETYDDGSDFNVATYTFTVPETGKYEIVLCVRFANPVAAKQYGAMIYNNTTPVVLGVDYAHAVSTDPMSISCYYCGALTVTHAIKFQAISNSGGDTVDITGTNDYSTRVFIRKIIDNA